MFDGQYWQCLDQQWFSDKDETVTGPVVVLGAGIIGLTTALAVRAACPKAVVSVVAKDFALPTSAVSAGVWFPFMGGTDERTNRFARETYEQLLEWVATVEAAHGSSQNLAACARERRQKSAPSNPIVTTDGWTLSQTQGQHYEQHIPAYVRGQRRLAQEELPHECWKSGLEWTTIVMQSHLYLPMLRRLCAAHGIRMEQQNMASATAFAREQPQGTVVVNCTGLGSVQLLSDSELYPVQGSIVKIDPAPDVTGGRFLDCLSESGSQEYAYVIPRTDCYVLGGTGVPHAWSRDAPSAEAVRGIMERCERLAPGLKAVARIQKAQTDLRPVRPRLALGVRGDVGAEGVVWIDSYGYGGSGWTVHLGAAAEAVRLVKHSKKRPAKL